MAGVSRLQYSPEIRLIRVMCTGRVDPAFLLRAFANGQDGVFVGGCRLKECNYITHGNFYALTLVMFFQAVFAHIGLNPERLRIRFMSSGEGLVLVEEINAFSRAVHGFGPLGAGEGLDADTLALRLAALSQMVPYFKFVLRERLRLPHTSLEDHRRFFDGPEFKALFDQAVAAPLELSQIMILGRDPARSVEEIAARLGVPAARVAQRLDGLRREELGRLDDRRRLAIFSREFVSYYIDPERCQACQICARKCPVQAIDGAKRTIHVIDQDRCVRCGTCLEVCPPRFRAVTKIADRPAPPPIAEEKRMLARKSGEK